MNCTINCVDCLNELCMHRVPLFSTLTYDELKNVADRMVCCVYEKGETLFSASDTPRSVTVILEGNVKIYTLSSDGREKILSVLSADDYFGELHLFGDEPASCSAEALERVKTCSFKREDFSKLMMDHPQMAVKLVEELGKRVVHLERVLQNAASGRVDLRIAALLLEFSKKYSENGPDGPEVLLPLSREGMANYLGIARETLSRKLKQMEDNGLIAAVGNKRLRIVKPELLDKMALGDYED